MDQIPALLPDPDATWRVWLQNGGPGLEPEPDKLTTPELSELDQELRVGLPANLCRTVGLCLPENVDRDAVHSMTLAQLEKRGLALNGEADFRSTTVGAEAGRQFISVDVLPVDLPDEVCLPDATDYSAALRYFHFPSDALVITRQFGRLVIAAGKNGQLVHAHCVGPAETPLSGLAPELVSTAQGLQSTGLHDGVRRIVLWGDFAADQIAGLQQLIGWQVGREEVQLAASSSHGGSTSIEVGSSTTKLLPGPVRMAKAKSQRRRSLIRWALIGLGVYLLGVLVLLLVSRSAANQRGKLQVELERVEPAAIEVKAMAERWRAMAPITDHRQFPMFVLGEITQVMPPGGIDLEEFRTDKNSIRVRGAARDAQAAFRLLEDLRSTPSLSIYDWEMPQPRMNNNNTADFDITAKLNR